MMVRETDLVVWEPFYTTDVAGPTLATNLSASLTVPTGQIWELTTVAVRANGAAAGNELYLALFISPTTVRLKTDLSSPIPANTIVSMNGRILTLPAGVQIRGTWSGSPGTTRTVNLTVSGRRYYL